MTRRPAPPQVLDSTHFRRVLGHFATGVTVVTTLDDEEPVGFTCQSFSSLSLDPPLVTVAPQRTSTTWPRIRRVGRFCANILAEDQSELATGFARTGTDKFAGRRWSTSPSGCPVLEDVLAWVDCEIVHELDGGDHVLVLARVLDLAVLSDEPPLLFFRGRFASLRTSEPAPGGGAGEVAGGPLRSSVPRPQPG
jgi:3-hydroxy-9,10-secoandrosta-1,3,5(10)-triene-9,17-dione monooxygenase reductase component